MKLLARWTTWESWSRCMKGCRQQRRRFCVDPSKRGGRPKPKDKVKNSLCIRKRALTDRLQWQYCQGDKCDRSGNVPTTNSPKRTTVKPTTLQSLSTRYQGHYRWEAIRFIKMLKAPKNILNLVRRALKNSHGLVFLKILLSFQVWMLNGRSGLSGASALTASGVASEAASCPRPMSSCQPIIVQVALPWTS